MTSGCQTGKTSLRLMCVLLSLLTSGSDYLSRGVLRPIVGVALRGGK
jgi:hypothetical protein